MKRGEKERMSKLEYSKRRMCVARTDAGVCCECSFYYSASHFWHGRLQIGGGGCSSTWWSGFFNFCTPSSMVGEQTKDVSGGFDLCWWISPCSAGGQHKQSLGSPPTVLQAVLTPPGQGCNVSTVLLVYQPGQTTLSVVLLEMFLGSYEGKPACFSFLRKYRICWAFLLHWDG